MSTPVNESDLDSAPIFRRQCRDKGSCRRLNLLISSYAFSPSIGGIESVTGMLAGEFVRRGHVVTVITETPADDNDVTFPFRVVRRPNPRILLKLVHDCDVFFHNNISVRNVWPLLFIRRPWVVTLQGCIPTWQKSHSWRMWVKRRILRFAHVVAISRAVADDVAVPTRIIHNPYDPDVFCPRDGVARRGDVVFVGRLIDAKGAHLLLEALARLREEGIVLKLTIVGGGPEEERLRSQMEKLGISGQVEFLGVRRGDSLAEVINAHHVMAVPSVWEEPFGVVALEGIASGCVVVGSESGGLKDAIGPCGVTFPNGDALALAVTLRDLFTHRETWRRYQQNAPAHLAAHTKTRIADAYLDLFRAVTK